MNRPTVVSQADWVAARKELLAREKEFTRLRDELSAERRKLPMVKVEKEYIFSGPEGPTSMLELFDGRRQLIVYHFMFDPDWDQGCKSYSFFADNFVGSLVHLAARDTSFAVISRAPISKIEEFKKRMGWTFRWLSSFDNDFNYDFHVTLDDAKSSVEYNYENAATLVRIGRLSPGMGELPGLSVFLRDRDSVFYTYSTYQRGLDSFLNTYNFLDLTPFGRQEDDDRPQSWVRHHDRYGHQVAAGRV